ncbi:TetR family transcriptional regulator [Nocardia aobensis]|uniref:TetR family transcriptional regulator n=1 Tax=Nocardia aobensis TaxID=257277 RepID=A0ABW6NWG0_9NOCA|nr:MULTISPECIES: TetR family transcriptional regulator [Nocardia]
MSASGEMIQVRPRPIVQEAIDAASAACDCTGTRALRVVLHAGVSAMWSAIRATPQRQVHTLDLTISALRRRWEGEADCSGLSATEWLRDLDAEVGAALDACAERSNTQWIEPVTAISAYVLAVIQGAVLRWLADGDDETTLVVLDDLVATLITKAVDR